MGAGAGGEDYGGTDRGADGGCAYGRSSGCAFLDDLLRRIMVAIPARMQSAVRIYTITARGFKPPPVEA